MPRIMLTACLMLMLSACSGGATPDQINDWCGLDHLILIDNADVLTPGTARQILAHNEVGQQICGW